MATTEQTGPQTAAGAEHVDVLIIGAGISGIGAAYYLQRDQPQRSYAILEARAATGGTWDLFKYPGIRSDSDLHTFGYDFKPWKSDHSLADGPDILAYIRETAAENGIDAHIRTGHRVISANFDSETTTWTTTVERGEETIQITSTFLFAGTGYYNYEQAYTPEFPGIEAFEGQVVHPQFWPEDLDYSGKRVVVIGSGATAVTLVPAMAPEAEHVTMLQRSPSYIMPLPAKDPVTVWLKRVFGYERGYRFARRWVVKQQATFYNLCQSRPKLMRRFIRRANMQMLPKDYPVDVHFKPSYGPWDQRLCAVPDGDLFKAIGTGKAEVVTDHIERFDRTGIRLESGQHLDADIVITATGLKLLAFGGTELSIDGTPVSLNDHLAFRGMMLSEVPNMVFLVGYTNSSWTLKVCLVCQHFMRMLGYMDEHGYNKVTAQPPYPGMSTRPLLDFQAGYVQRALDEFPRQGAYQPWQQNMSVKLDTELLQNGPIEDRNLVFETAPSSSTASVPAQVAA
jgi:monooxygenase